MSVSECQIIRSIDQSLEPKNSESDVKEQRKLSVSSTPLRVKPESDLKIMAQDCEYNMDTLSSTNGQGEIKSYSDFIRNLAARYNNNEYHDELVTEKKPLPKETIQTQSATIKNFPLFLSDSNQISSPTKIKERCHFHPNYSPATSECSSINLKGQSVPLDLSESFQSSKRPRYEEPSQHVSDIPKPLTPSSMTNWSVEQVASFVESVELCQGYSETFVDHHIDGSLLPVLTEDHLTQKLGMKLGPALKLKSILSKIFGTHPSQVCFHCSHCIGLRSQDIGQKNISFTNNPINTNVNFNSRTESINLNQDEVVRPSSS